MATIARLFEAAHAGNVETLLQLMADDPSILGAVALTGTDTPLHTACLAGHHDFVKMLVGLRPEFARELNQDGFSPLHIASANGYVEIVKELLNVDRNLCLLEGRERRIPLHFAAIKGRVRVIEELLSANVDSITMVTARGETALQLAVKNNQFGSLGVLVEHLQPHNKEFVLNKKDNQGNTILHVAVSRKQFEVVQLVFSSDATKGMVEVNAMNETGLTPLDLLLLFESEAGDREIEQILRQAGAKQSQELHQLANVSDTQNNQVVTNIYITNIPSEEYQSTRKLLWSIYKQLCEYLKYKKIKDSPAEVRNILLVVAVLIATATFQAALTPPGGVWQEDTSLIPIDVTAIGVGIDRHVAGTTILGSKNCVAHCILLFFNSIGFVTALHIINILTVGFYLRLELLVSTAALLCTYYISMVSVAPPNSGILPVDVFMWASIILPAAAFLFVNILWRHRDAVL